VEADGASASHSVAKGAATAEPTAAAQVLRTRGQAHSLLQPMAIHLGAAKRLANTSSAASRRDRRMLRASVETIVVLSLQAGARVAASHIVEQVTTADEAVVIRFAQAARSRSASAAVAASPSQPATTPPLWLTALHQLASPEKLAVATACNTAEAPSPPLVAHVSRVAVPLSALPAGMFGGSPHLVPADVDAAALAAIGTTLGALRSVHAQLNREARLEPAHVGKTALWQLFTCGAVFAWCAGVQSRHRQRTRQQPSNSLRKQVQPLSPSRTISTSTMLRRAGIGCSPRQQSQCGPAASPLV